MTLLDDAFHKLNRGNEHLANFIKNAEDTLAQATGLTTDLKLTLCPKPPGVSDPRPWTKYTLSCPSVPSIEKSDEILLGEAIQSFRSSLDYLAWDWVSEAAKKRKATLTEIEMRNVMFPMAFKEKKFRGNIAHLKFITSKQKKFIKRYQPFRRTIEGKALRWLTILSNTDKHRIIVPALMSPQVGDINFHVHPSLVCISEIHHLNINREIRAGDKIMSLILAGEVPTKEPSVHVDVKLILYPIFSKTIIRQTSTNGILLVEKVLNSISAVCTEILTKARDEFT